MIQRYENNGYMEDFRPESNGEWVKYEDHKERVERLEAALRHEIANCVNCEGTGTFTCGKCKDNVPHTCKRCANARTALTNDAGEGS